MEVIENHLLIFIFDLQTACRKGLNKGTPIPIVIATAI